MGEKMMMMMNNDNRYTMRLDNDIRLIVKHCPFCGKTSVSATHTEVRFIQFVNGFNYAKKIIMKCYCTCNYCHTRSKPIVYVGYADAPRDFYDDDHPHIYDFKYKIKALEEWNRRAEQ